MAIRPSTAICVLALLLTTGSADAIGPGATAAVSAVYHEGVVTFRVDRPDAVSVRVQVSDAVSDELLFDSRPLRGTIVAWAPGAHDGSWRYRVDAWNAAGELVTSQVASSKGVEQIYAIDFDVVPGESTLRGGAGGPIVLDGAVSFGAPAYASLERDAFGSVLTLDSGTPALFLSEEPPAEGGGPPPQVFSVDLLELGDTSVEAPVDSISAPEILDEPGVVFNATSGLNALSGLETILAATVFVPADGWLMATAALDFQFNHVSGTTSSVQTGLNLDDDSAIPSTQALDVLFPGPATTGTYYSAASPVAVFAATAGPHTVYLLAEELSGAVTAHEANLAIVYLPTTYGLIERPNPGLEASPRDDFDAADVAAERAAAIAADTNRRAAERADAGRRAAGIRSRHAGDHR